MIEMITVCINGATIALVAPQLDIETNYIISTTICTCTF